MPLLRRFVARIPRKRTEREAFVRGGRCVLRHALRRSRRGKTYTVTDGGGSGEFLSQVLPFARPLAGLSRGGRGSLRCRLRARGGRSAGRGVGRPHQALMVQEGCKPRVCAGGRARQVTEAFTRLPQSRPTAAHEEADTAALAHAVLWLFEEMGRAGVEASEAAGGPAEAPGARQHRQWARGLSLAVRARRTVRLCPSLREATATPDAPNTLTFTL